MLWLLSEWSVFSFLTLIQFPSHLDASCTGLASSPCLHTIRPVISANRSPSSFGYASQVLGAIVSVWEREIKKRGETRLASRGNDDGMQSRCCKFIARESPLPLLDYLSPPLASVLRAPCCGTVLTSSPTCRAPLHNNCLP